MVIKHILMEALQVIMSVIFLVLLAGCWFAGYQLGVWVSEDHWHELEESYGQR